ncbi:MAG: hypothetical protein V4671_31975, partial [Armatimonadota bacterium]
MATYPTGRSITVERGIRYTVDIGTENGFTRQVPGGAQTASQIKGIVRLTQSNNAILNVTGTGELVYTETYTETCTITGDEIAWTWTPAGSARSMSGISNTGAVAAFGPAAMIGMPIKRVEAFCNSHPAVGPLYDYVSGATFATCEIEWVYTVNGVQIDVPDYGLNASGAGSAASQNYVEANALVGSTITARSSRFGSLNLSGSPGSYVFLSDIGQAFTPRLDIDAVFDNRYSDGSLIAASEFAALSATNVSVLFEKTDNAVVCAIPEGDAAGRLMSCGRDTAYTMVFKGSESTTAMQDNLNGTYGSGDHWMKFVYNVSQATPGAVAFTDIGTTTYNYRVNPAGFLPGFDLYTSVPDIDTGYTALLASVDTLTISGAWSTTGGGTGLLFTPASNYVICGYRWLTVTLSSASGGTATIGAEVQTIPAGESVTFIIDRFGDTACQVEPPDSLGSPSVTVAKTGTVTGGAVTGTHIAPEGYSETISGAAVYFSRTNALPTGAGNDGDPHTLAMICLFSGGCPGLRLDDMSIDDLLDFFTDNPAAGMAITLASGSLTPTAGTREAAHYGNGLYLSSLNS